MSSREQSLIGSAVTGLARGFGLPLAMALGLTGCLALPLMQQGARPSALKSTAADADADADADASVSAEPGLPAGTAAVGRQTLRPVRSTQPLDSFVITRRSYAGELDDFGTMAFTSLIPNNYTGMTPLLMPGARRLDTYALHELLLRKKSKAPVLINVQPSGPNGAELIAGAVWLSGAGAAGRFDDDNQRRLNDRLKALTGGDRRRAIVFYCRDIGCWEAYNAGTRAVVLGYRGVHWYRGGLRAWFEAGLPAVATREDRW